MKKWRFPNNNYGPENGLDTSDMETFKKDPDGSLAREICQNTIDAQLNKDIPTRVEFKLFEVDRNLIPGIDDLASQINSCYEYKKSSTKEEKPLRKIKESINKNIIKCLRISDFNTTGLLGVSSNEKNKPFYNLTKGSGISDKQGTSGGSKGIGKFASFVASTTNTVFYSTKTSDCEKGFIGISKLRSAPIPGDDKDAFTQGIGYYAVDEKNYPILEELKLDSTFSRKEDEYGTDLFIVGFNDKDNWISAIISKVLDSFMYAIINQGFEVVVGDYAICKDNLYNIIYNSNVLKKETEATKKRIKAQYELLTEDTVSSNQFDIDGYGKITVYVKSYSAKDGKRASKRCEMIRYPFMKIKHKTGLSYLPFSAICVIDDSELNEKLRIIENPQHTDWEIKRLNDYPNEKRITKNILKKIDVTIEDYVHTVLSENNGDSTDLEGAGYYLPSDEENGINLGEIIIKDSVKVSKFKKNKVTKPKTVKQDENGESYDISTGELVDGEPEGRKLTEPTDDPHPNPGPKPEPNEENEKEIVDGKKKVLRRVPLNGTKFRTVVKNKKMKEYDVVFTSQFNGSYCELELKQIGDKSDKYVVNISKALIANEECEIKDGKIIGLRIEKGKKYKITCITDVDDLFSSEVVLNAFR